MQLRLASEVSKIFGVKIPVTRIVESVNLSELAKMVDGLTTKVCTPSTSGARPTAPSISTANT